MFIMENIPACPVETTLLLIGNKWKVLILRDMEAQGLVTRKVYAEVPPRVEYSLTGLGESLRPVLASLDTWGRGYQREARRQKAR